MSELIFNPHPVSLIDYSDDCVNRNDVIDAFGHGNSYYTSDDIIKIIKSLPSVEPIIKKAKWIEDGYYDLPCVCSYCGEEGSYEMEYCPNCGARMEE